MIEQELERKIYVFAQRLGTHILRLMTNIFTIVIFVIVVVGGVVVRALPEVQLSRYVKGCPIFQFSRMIRAYRK